MSQTTSASPTNRHGTVFWTLCLHLALVSMSQITTCLTDHSPYPSEGDAILSGTKLPIFRPDAIFAKWRLYSCTPDASWIAERHVELTTASKLKFPDDGLVRPPKFRSLPYTVLQLPPLQRQTRTGKVQFCYFLSVPHQQL